MQIERTPPKKKVEFSLSTPPPKQNPEHSSMLPKSNIKSSRKSTPKSFSPTKTPAKSFRKSEQSSGEDEPSRLSEDYYFHKQLGSGNFSSVGLYESKMTGQFFAIKRNKASSISVNEIQALATTSMLGEKNKNIVRYFHSWIEGEYCYIAMQYCRGSLEDIFQEYRQRGSKLTEEYLIRLLKEILSGLVYLHEHNMVHLDLKPENILFNQGVVKISDLGLCRLARVKKWMELIEGDSRYLDRMILNYNDKIDLTKADIFSLGMTLYEAISMEDLPNNGDRWQQLRDGMTLVERMDLQEYSKEFLKMIERMIDPDPTKRPSARQLLELQVLKPRKPLIESFLENSQNEQNKSSVHGHLRILKLNQKSVPKTPNKCGRRDNSL